MGASHLRKPVVLRSMAPCLFLIVMCSSVSNNNNSHSSFWHHKSNIQALGATSRTSDVNARLGKGVRAPRQEYIDPSAAPQPHVAPDPAPQPSATFVPPQPPPRSGVPPPQPSTSGWVPSGPPRSRGSRLSSESEASETESEVAARDNTSARLADLIYEACPHSRPLLDDSRPPRFDFEGWFGQPECSASRPRFRLYPRVGEVESEVTAHAEALAR